ncbi:MAG: N-acetylglucosamine-6-phosphate deacetylase [Clostridia bacterium]
MDGAGVLRGRIVLRDRVLDDGMIVLAGDRIREVGGYRPGAGPLVYENREAFLAPGLIDVHTHGLFGLDTMDARPGGLAEMAALHLALGVTGFVASTITASADSLARAVQRAGADLAAVPSCLGLHLEGPYLNSANAGAQPPEWLRDPSVDEMADLYARSQGTIRMVTLAPERPGALELVRWLADHDIIPAIGHTSAGPEDTRAALECGARQATHLFNGMPPIRSRGPGPVPFLLQDDRVFLELIADGVHVDPSMVGWTVAMAGVDRMVLVTDSIRAAGLEDGSYDLGGHQVTVAKGVARTAGGSLAGSTLRLVDGVFNMVNFAGVDVPAAFRMATLNPARALRRDREMGSLEAGKQAHVIAVSPAGEVLRTWFAGRAVNPGSDAQRPSS